MKTWQNCLTSQIELIQPTRLAIVGVGNTLMGDDGVGVYLAHHLTAYLTDMECYLVLEAGIAPENCLHRLRQFAPHAVLFLDAVALNDDAGTVHWIDWTNVTGLSFSTHTLPLTVVVEYLQAELGCAVWGLGIQPDQVTWRASLSSVLRISADNIVAEIAECLRLRQT